jgi:hypothetical protein
VTAATRTESGAGRTRLTDITGLSRMLVAMLPQLGARNECIALDLPSRCSSAGGKWIDRLCSDAGKMFKLAKLAS